MNSSSPEIERFFSGQALYGDDLSAHGMQAWFEDEKEGYADLGAKDASNYSYGYHALNLQHGYRHLSGQSFKRLLGFGSAYGEELRPLLPAVNHVTIVDPSLAFVRPEVFGTPATYVQPMPDGKLPFADSSFDLMTCFGVLHHIPNVSYVVREMARVLEPSGQMLLREPIVSMGDWRHPRRGLTKHERGIPLQLLRNMLRASGLEVVKETLCMFPTTPRLFGAGKKAAYNSRLAVAVDAAVSSAFTWNLNYHPKTQLQRLRPTSAFYVLRKAA